MNGPPDDLVPELATDFLRRDLGDGSIVWSRYRGTPTALDPVASVMLDVVDGSASLGELATEVHEEVGIPYELAQQQVRRVIGTFDGAGLLTTSSRGDLAGTTIANRRLFTRPASH